MVYNGILYVSNTFKYSTPIFWDPNSCIVRNILMFIWGDLMLGGRDSQTLQTGFWNMRNIYCIIIYHHQERRDIPRTKKQWMYHQQHPKTAAPHTFGHVSQWIGSEDQRNHPLCRTKDRSDAGDLHGFHAQFGAEVDDFGDVATTEHGRHRPRILQQVLQVVEGSG